MAGAVHLVDESDTTNDGSRPGLFPYWLQTAIFVCLAAVAICAPISTKGAVNAFRAAILLWLIFVCSGKRRLFAQPLALPITLFLVLTGVSSVLSFDPYLSWGRMRTVSLLFLAVLVRQAIRSTRQLKLLSALMIGSCLLTVIYTGWQYTGGIGVQASGSPAALAPLRRFGIVRGDILRKLGGKSLRSPRDISSSGFSPDQTELVLWRETPNALQTFRMTVDAKALQTALQAPGMALKRAHPPRAQGFFKHYFPFSEILAFVAVLIWGFAVSGIPNRKLRIASLIAFFATALTLALTLTRISLASLIAGIVVITILHANRRMRWITSAAFLLILVGAIAWVEAHRAAPGSDPGTVYRLLMWKDSVKLIRAHPWFGVGLDSVAGDWQRWNLEAYRRFGLHSHFHSSPIQIAVECGLPAFAVWVWLLAAYGRFLVRSYRTAAGPDWFARGLLLGACGGLVGFVLTGFLQYNFGDAEAMVVFYFVMGMTFALQRLDANLLPATRA